MFIFLINFLSFTVFYTKNSWPKTIGKVTLKIHNFSFRKIRENRSAAHGLQLETEDWWIRCSALEKLCAPCRGEEGPTNTYGTPYTTRDEVPALPPKSTQGMIEVTTLVIFHEWNSWWRNIINKKNKKE